MNTQLEEASDAAVDSEAAAGNAPSLARALVRIPSVNPLLEAGGPGEAAAARRAAEWLEAWGFDTELTEIAPGRLNVVARHRSGAPGTGGRTLLFNGHLDTVGVAGMVVPPFAADVRDGRLYGRGSCDMKGGVGALLSAAASLARTGHAGTLIVALTADEEHASLGMQALVADGIRADGAVVCEPTELAVMPAHKGFVWLRAVFRGRAAHGSRPEVGIDAVRHAALYVAALEGLAQKLASTPPHPLLGRPSFHVGTIQGGAAASVYPESCEVVLERRYYRAIVRPFFGERDWKKLPKNARGSISDAVLQLVWEDASEAIKSGQFDERDDRHLSRTVLAVDEQGWGELQELLAGTLDRAMEIQVESASRASKEEDGDTFCANLVMVTHPTPSSARQTTAPSSGTRKRRTKKATAKA